MRLRTVASSPTVRQIDMQVDEHADERGRGQEACQQRILRDGPREEGEDVRRRQ